MSTLLRLSQMPGIAGDIFFRIRALKNKIRVKIKGTANQINIRNTAMRNMRIEINGTQNICNPGKSILIDSLFRISGNYNEIRIEEGALLESCSIKMMGHGHKVFIDKNCRLRNVSLWLEDVNDSISIGAGTTMEGAHIAATEPGGIINIGNDCMFSFGIDIRNGDSHVILDQPSGERINSAKDIRIDEHVWIGAYVQILKGVHIQKGSVVGIRSVVARDIPEHSLVVGSPAKVIRQHIEWERDRSKWFQP